MFKRRGINDIPRPGRAVSVPGAVDGWFALHEKFGRKPMSDNLAPAIRYAREGHPVHEVIAYYWDRSVPRLKPYPGFLEQFTINGRAPARGEIWKNPNLADTLQKIASGGRDAFYKGDIARTIDAYFKANGGFLSYADLAAHQGEWVEPVSTNYRGYDVWELPPNSQGIAALQILNLLEAYDLKQYGFGSAEHVHLFAEAKKLAFVDRAHLYADPAFYKTPVAKLVSKAYAQERGKLISMDKAARTVSPGIPPELNEGAPCISQPPCRGMMVSLIQSNYREGLAWRRPGSVTPERGEMLVLKEGPEQLGAGKRPSRPSSRRSHQGGSVAGFE